MPIQTISRDWGVAPSIVRIVTTDNLNTILTTGYINTQYNAINDYNKGVFEWTPTDLIAIKYSDGEGFFKRDAVTNSFVAEDPLPGEYATTQLDNLSDTAVNEDILPDTDETLNLGSSSLKWDAVYVTTAAPLDGSNKAASTEYVDLAVQSASGGALPFPPVSDASLAISNGLYAIATVPGLMGLDYFSSNLNSVLYNQNVIFVPYSASKTVNITELAINVDTDEAASTATVGIYESDSDGLPTGDPIVEESIDTSATGLATTGAITVELTAGNLYWFAVQLSSALTVSITCGGLAISPFLGFVDPTDIATGNSALSQWIMQANTYVDGTLPTIGTLIPTGTSLQVLPIIMFK